MTKTPLRVGLIGVGGVGHLHYETYGRAEKVKVVAVCDTSAERIAALKLPSGIAAYSDAKEMLRQEKLDIACVMTPPSSHESLTLLCLQAGVHVLCEKPLTLSLASAERMIAAADKAGLLLFYGSSYRHLPAVKAARDLILSGAIGQVRLLREQSLGGRGLDEMQVMHASHYPQGGPGGFAMGIADHGIHLIDVMGWMMDSPILSASGRANVSGKAALPEHLAMNFANGAVGHLLYDEGTYPTELPTEGAFSGGDGWDVDGFVRAGSWTKYPSAIHVYGSHGALRIFHYANMLVLIDGSGLRQIPLQGWPAPYHFAAQIDAFASDILKGGPASTPPSVGLAALKILLGALAN